jgi:Flp pilus assembly protein TadG
MIGASLIRKFRGCRRGTAAIEFAFVAPVFIILVMGIFEMGRAMWIKATMQYALEETARYAVVNTSVSTATLEAYAASRISGIFVNSGSVSVSATTSISAGTTYVLLTASYSFNTLVPIVKIPSVTLQARSQIPVS